MLGGVIGDEISRSDFMKDKIIGWISELVHLTVFAVSQPQAAFAAFTKLLQFKLNYLQHVVPTCDTLYEKLEQVISTKLLPTVLGCEVSPAERKLFSLPARLGGFGVSDPTELNDLTYKCSRDLSDVIV